MSRVDERQGFDTETRLRLLERDADTLEGAVERQNQLLNRIFFAILGLLISVSTACIMFAVNLGAGS